MPDSDLLDATSGETILAQDVQILDSVTDEASYLLFRTNTNVMATGSTTVDRQSLLGFYSGHKGTASDALRRCSNKQLRYLRKLLRTGATEEKVSKWTRKANEDAGRPKLLGSSLLSGWKERPQFTTLSVEDAKTVLSGCDKDGPRLISQDDVTIEWKRREALAKR